MERSILEIPYDINLLIIKKGVSNPPSQVVDSKYQKILQDSLPYYRVRSNQTNKKHIFRLKLTHTVTEVFDSSILDQYQVLLNRQNTDFNGNHLIAAKELMVFVDDTFTKYWIEQSLFRMNIIIFPHELALPPHAIYTNDPKECTQSVFSNIALIDLTAEFCDLSSSLSALSKTLHLNPLTMSTAFELNNFPANRALAMKLTPHKVLNIVNSAIESFAVSPFKWREGLNSDEIYCPIIILRGNDNRDTTYTQPLQIDIFAIKQWLHAMLLPNQKIKFAIQDYYLDQHPQVATAITLSQKFYSNSKVTKLKLNNSLPTDTTQSDDAYLLGVPYIDSLILHKELSLISDELFHQLLTKAGFTDNALNLYEVFHEGKYSYHNINVQSETFNDVENKSKGDLIHFKPKLIDLQTQCKKYFMRKPFSVIPIIIIDNPYLILNEASQSVEISNSAVSDNRKVVSLFDIDSKVAIHDNHIFLMNQRPFYTRSKEELLKHSPFRYCSRTNKWIREISSEDNPIANDMTTSSAFDGKIDAYATAVHGLQDEEGVLTRLTSTSLEGRIIESLSHVLTGVRSPHQQLLESQNLTDLTWTHGIYPFSPFGDASQLRSNRGWTVEQMNVGYHNNMLTWMSRRNILIGQSIATMHNINELGRDVNHLFRLAIQTIDLYQQHQDDIIHEGGQDPFHPYQKELVEDMKNDPSLKFFKSYVSKDDFQEFLINHISEICVDRMIHVYHESTFFQGSMQLLLNGYKEKKQGWIEAANKEFNEQLHDLIRDFELTHQCVRDNFLQCKVTSISNYSHSNELIERNHKKRLAILYGSSVISRNLEEEHIGIISSWFDYNLVLTIVVSMILLGLIVWLRISRGIQNKKSKKQL